MSLQHKKIQQLGVIGHFGAGLNLHDGQTVKTKTLSSALETYFDTSILKVDTHGYRAKPIKLLLQIMRCFFKCDAVFVLLSRNGRKILFPFMVTLSKLSGCKIYHCLIGGNLADEVEANPTLVKTLNAFAKNWVETKSMATRLQQAGVENAYYLPNFKSLEPIDFSKRSYSESPPFHLSTFSRVMDEKGITEAIRSVKRINELKKCEYCTLDIYGPIEDSYKEQFEKELKGCGAAKYCGVIEYSNSVGVLSQYDLLLFPTKWEGEGIPGTIIDAFAAGLPVIASRWRYYNEMLEDGVTGLSFSYKEKQPLVTQILILLENPQLIKEYGKNCREKYRHFSVEAVLEIINKSVF